MRTADGDRPGEPVPDLDGARVAVGRRREQLGGRGPAEPARPGDVERRPRGVLLQAAQLTALARAARRARASGARSRRRRRASRGAAGPRAAGPAARPVPSARNARSCTRRLAGPLRPVDRVRGADDGDREVVLDPDVHAQALRDERRERRALLDAEVDGVLDQRPCRRRRPRAARCRRRPARADRHADAARPGPRPPRPRRRPDPAAPHRGQPDLVAHHAVARRARRRAPWCRRCRAPPTTGVVCRPTPAPAASGSPACSRQPFTAPATSPDVILFCTNRKKMITGTAMSAEPAMTTPQSVARLVCDEPLQPQRQRVLRRVGHDDERERVLVPGLQERVHAGRDEARARAAGT